MSHFWQNGRTLRTLRYKPLTDTNHYQPLPAYSLNDEYRSATLFSNASLQAAYCYTSLPSTGTHRFLLSSLYWYTYFPASLSTGTHTLADSTGGRRRCSLSSS